MSTSASAGAAAGRRMGGAAHSVKQSKVFGAVAAGAFLIYAAWEVRVRASAKAGKLPRSYTEEWQFAAANRAWDAELTADPHHRVVLNPHRHAYPPHTAMKEISSPSFSS